MGNRHLVDRKLPERAKLIFYFPIPSQGSNYYTVELPFFENVQIKESKKAKYQKYSLISRSSNLYSYLGADSRSLQLSFNMTMPHILDLHPDISPDKYMPYKLDADNLDGEREKFKQPYRSADTIKGMAFELGTEYTQKFAQDSARAVLLNGNITGALNNEDKHFIQSRYGVTEASMNELNVKSNLVKNVVKNPLSLFNPVSNAVNAVTAAQEEAKLEIENNQDMSLKYRIIDLIIYWTNIIRSSVVNYSKNPIYGPPTIRLRHGILYQDIPCICTDYNISYNEAAGYDMDTLLPRQLKVTMKLEELRTGDFGEFDTTDIIKRDNLTGWEAVVLGDTASMDPGYGGIV
jgi:hypothetical protein